MSRTSPTVDGLVAFWVVLWLVVGAWTGVEVWRLSDLSTTVASSGRTLDDAGEALQALEPVPLVGDDAATLGTSVRTEAVGIVQQASAAQGSIRRLALLLGLSIALVPSAPVLLLHAAVRRGTLTLGR